MFSFIIYTQNLYGKQMYIIFIWKKHTIKNYYFILKKHSIKISFYVKKTYYIIKKTIIINIYSIIIKKINIIWNVIYKKITFHIFYTQKLVNLTFFNNNNFGYVENIVIFVL